MKRLSIRNLGPVREAEIELGRANVIIGQAAGKSCVMKTAAFCARVEREIGRAPSYRWFGERGSFLRDLLAFYRMEGYGREDTRIGYETDLVRLGYDNSTGEFDIERKEGRQDCQCPQIAYIPTERNMVAAVPNWKDAGTGDDYVRGFMLGWERARRSCGKKVDIPILDVTYRFDKTSHSDLTGIGGGRETGITNASSGLKSAVPLYVFVNYITGCGDGKEPRPCELFIEEPESGLFPPIQCRFAQWLMEKAAGGHRLFVSTHSPYILSAFVESKPDDFRLLFLKRAEDGGATVRTATPDDISEINYYGTDPFINIEAYNKREYEEES